MPKNNRKVVLNIQAWFKNSYTGKYVFMSRKKNWKKIKSVVRSKYVLSVLIKDAVSCVTALINE